jgi:transglutaminase-like putative cysteine protease
MERRRFLETTTIGIAAAALLGRLERPGVAATSEAAAGGWRTFELTTRLEIAGAIGGARAWVPLPLMRDTPYQTRLGDTWNGNASRVRRAFDHPYGAGILEVEWPASEIAPVIEVVSRVSTRDRSVDLEHPSHRFAQADAATLNLCLRPTALIPTDGIVLETSRGITKGARSEIDKARAIYEWIVENTFRDPKVPGCGIGNVKAMLETRHLSGKCADLNALFVGLARAARLPARDVYGIRVADSKEFKSLGKSGNVTKAQHCRAEFYATGYGWVPVDPADVRKVVLEEPPGGRSLDDPLVQRARAKLFGSWEMNWVAFNYAHDVRLPESTGRPLPFLMYPQCETGAGRKDPLDPASFEYRISAELSEA